MSRAGGWCLLVLYLTTRTACAGQVFPESRRTTHLLDYVAGDYPGALASNSPDEIKEQLEFIDEAVSQLKVLPDRPGRKAIVDQIVKVRELIEKRTPAVKVTGLLQSASGQVTELYPSGLQLPSHVSRENGAAVYKQACMACHGPAGDGAGRAAPNLDPKPASFIDPERMAKMSPVRAFNSISFGVSRTSMPSFAQGLSEKDRWDAAAYVFTFRRTPGAPPLDAPPALRPIAELLQSTDEALERRLAESGAGAIPLAREHLRRISTYEQKTPPIARAKQHLNRARDLHRAGDVTGAANEALEAYLGGYEEVEPLMKVLQPILAVKIEQAMQRLPRQIRAGITPAALDGELDSVFGLLSEAAGSIDGSQAHSHWIPLSAALLIIGREGLEAILVLAMLLAVLRKIGCGDQARLVYRGALAALVAGFMVWGGAVYAFRLAAIHREISEAITSLLAAALLYWAGLWMLSRLESQRWLQMIKNQLHGSISGGSQSGVVVLSFLAVFREVVETMLFFQALVNQYPGQLAAIVQGAVLGIALLCLAAYLLFVLGLRLPLSYFFGASSVGMLLLAIVMVGQAASSLGEAGFFLPGASPLVDAAGGPVGVARLVQMVMGLGFLITLVPLFKLSSAPPVEQS